MSEFPNRDASSLGSPTGVADWQPATSTVSPRAMMRKTSGMCVANSCTHTWVAIMRVGEATINKPPAEAGALRTWATVSMMASALSQFSTSFPPRSRQILSATARTSRSRRESLSF